MAKCLAKDEILVGSFETFQYDYEKGCVIKVNAHDPRNRSVRE